MPSFDLLHVLSWLHYTALALAIGGAVASLLLSGLEGEQAEFRGLSAALWAKQVRWGLRIAVMVGILMLLVSSRGACPLGARHLHFKLPLAILALVFSELAPKSLALHKRGAALLGLVLMLLASFVALNREAFHSRPRQEAPSAVSFR